MKYYYQVRLIALIFLISCTLSSNLFASSDDESTRRHYYGLYLGVDLGLVNQFEIAPLLGYKITPIWHTGIGGKYQYHNSKTLGNVFRAHIFGPFAYSDLVLVRDLNEFLPFRLIDAAFFIHAELNMFSLPSSHFDLRNEHQGEARFFKSTSLIGGGLRRHAGGNRNFHVLLMLDITGNRQIYSNPVLRFGLMF